MGPKMKRDRGVASSAMKVATPVQISKPQDRLEQLQADHELFLQAFEKPTQIYRYLRTRNLISPIFLNRTLTFMKKRNSRPNSDRKRQEFKVDSLLQRKENESKSTDNGKLDRFMNVTFLGYYDKKLDRPLDKVSVELVLVKLSHKKRKESSPTLPFVQAPLGNAEILVNPSDDHPPSKVMALSIPSESFNLANGHHIKSCSLLVKVHHVPLSQLTANVKLHDLDDSITQANGKAVANGDNNEENNEEPALKRRKRENNNGMISNGEPKLLSAELVVYDKHAHCLLTEGEYELILAEIDNANDEEELENLDKKPNAMQRKNATWENITIDKKDLSVYSQFEVFANSPTLKFRLSWSSEPLNGTVERPRPLMSRDTNCHAPAQTNGHASSDHNNLRRGRSRLSRQSSTVSNSSNGQQQQQQPRGLISSQGKTPRIVYHFLYNNNSRQQTEAREDLHCPWCSLNCLELYALLKHLKLSHPRFLFSYVPLQDGARIDVSVSELYDSTYVGNPHDMISQPPGFAFSRRGPVQGNSITHILVCKPKRAIPSLTEFLEIEENDLNGPYHVDGQRPFVSGHSRLYHYSTTCLPQPPYAINQPSTEDQVDPPWLMKKICRMIDEFSDVNEGEKEFMKMWNLHVQHYTYVGDCQMNIALRRFIEEKGKDLLAKDLYRNFVLHACNLFEFGVLGPAHVFAAILRLQKFAQEQGHAFEDWSAHRDFWVQNGPKKEATDTLEGGMKAQRKDFSGLFKSRALVVLKDIISHSSSSGSNLILAQTENNEEDNNEGGKELKEQQ